VRKQADPNIPQDSPVKSAKSGNSCWNYEGSEGDLSDTGAALPTVKMVSLEASINARKCLDTSYDPLPNQKILGRRRSKRRQESGVNSSYMGGFSNMSSANSNKQGDSLASQT
jgi:hypothetical protein